VSADQGLKARHGSGRWGQLMTIWGVVLEFVKLGSLAGLQQLLGEEREINFDSCEIRLLTMPPLRTRISATEKMATHPRYRRRRPPISKKTAFIAVFFCLKIGKDQSALGVGAGLKVCRWGYRLEAYPSPSSACFCTASIAASICRHMSSRCSRSKRRL